MEEYLTVKEAAQRPTVSTRVIYGYIKTYGLTRYRFPGDAQLCESRRLGESQGLIRRGQGQRPLIDPGPLRMVTFQDSVSIEPKIEVRTETPERKAFAENDFLT